MRLSQTQKSILIDGHRRHCIGSNDQLAVHCRGGKLRAASALERKKLGKVYDDQEGRGGWFAISQKGLQIAQQLSETSMERRMSKELAGQVLEYLEGYDLVGTGSSPTRREIDKYNTLLGELYDIAETPKDERSFW